MGSSSDNTPQPAPQGPFTQPQLAGPVPQYSTPQAAQFGQLGGGLMMTPGSPTLAFVPGMPGSQGSANAYPNQPPGIQGLVNGPQPVQPMQPQPINPSGLTPDQLMLYQVQQQTGQTPGGLMRMPDGTLQRAPQPMPSQQGGAFGAAPIGSVQQMIGTGMQPTWTGQHWVMPNGTIVDPGSTSGPQWVNGDWRWSDGSLAVFGPGTVNPGGVSSYGGQEGGGDSGNGEGGVGESGGSGASGGGGPGQGGGTGGSEADNV